MEQLKRDFGEAIKSQRSKRDLSQEKLAEIAGLHRTYISDVERGARNPSLGSIQKFAQALQIPIGELFGNAPKTGAEDTLVEILLVEDMAQDIELTLRALKHANITNRIQVVRDGAAALDFLFCTGEYADRRCDDHPQLILLDLGLPKVGGLEVLQRLKADARTRAIPVVVLTASNHDHDLVQCQRLGAEAFITKPVDFQNLSEITPKLNLQWALLKPTLA